MASIISGLATPRPPILHLVGETLRLPPPFDLDHLDQLRAALGQQRLQSLLDLFAIELDHRPGRLRDYVLVGRFDQARAEAHSLKGASMSVGANQLGNAARAIEQLDSGVDVRGNAALLVELDVATRAAQAALGGPALGGDHATRA